MSSSAAITELENKITAKAISMIDTDLLAIRLAKKLEDSISEAYDRVLEKGFDFESWLENELQDDSTPAGKSFAKAMQKIAKRMADAV